MPITSRDRIIGKIGAYLGDRAKFTEASDEKVAALLVIAEQLQDIRDILEQMRIQSKGKS